MPDQTLPVRLLATDVAERPEQQFAQLLTFGDQMLKTGFLPKAITTAAQAVAVILTGRELGLGPMQALRSISIITGKPVLAADLQLALFKRAGGRAKFTMLSDVAATLTLTDRGGDQHTESFTMADAKRAGLTTNATWTKYPKAMLRSRCITAALKSIGFEPTTGVYDPEELGGAPILEGETLVDASDSLERALHPPIGPETPLESGPAKGTTVGALGLKQIGYYLDHPDTLAECDTEERAQQWREALEAEMVRRADERKLDTTTPKALVGQSQGERELGALLGDTP